MGGIGEERRVQQVFPIAGEFLPRGDAAGERAGAPADAAQHDAVAGLRRSRRADRQRLEIETAERLHQAEAGFPIEAERMAFHHPAVAEMQPDGLGLGDQIADGQHQPVADHHAIAGALGAERLGGEGIGRNDGMQPDHRGQRALEVEPKILRARLDRRRHFPFGQRRHRGSPIPPEKFYHRREPS